MARAEVLRIVRQLLPLDGRMRTRGGDGSTSVQGKQHREQLAAATRRDVEVWLCWLDHQAGQPS